ncbi:MAG: SDR family oxidoreductase [Pseudomonadota bacterium]|nr:SDR family oxidoreductase [Pseudomonadota bacterium]
MSNNDLKERHILVTGSSSGIGKAVSEKLLAVGAMVYGIARDHDKFQPNSENYHPVNMDISDLKELSEQMLKLVMKQPKIDGLLSNAGYGDFGSLENFSPKQIISHINDNLVSHMIITRCILPHLKTKNGGNIIFIGSESALEGGAKGSLYAAAKFGLRGFAQSIRQEGSSKNIRVTLINPGMVRTNFFDSLKFKPGENQENAISPEDLADIVINVLSLNPRTVIDEINLTPLKKVIEFD